MQNTAPAGAPTQDTPHTSLEYFLLICGGAPFRREFSVLGVFWFN